MTTATITLPPPRRKARVRHVPGAALPLPSALPHVPCTHYQATYCQGAITVQDPSQAEALWYNGCFGHGAVVGGRGRPREWKKWRLVEAEGLKTPKWFKETRTERRGVEREVEENEMEVDLSEGKEEEEEREKGKGLEVMEVKEDMDKEGNEETEEVHVKEDKEEEEEEKKGGSEMEEETQNMETKKGIDAEEEEKEKHNKINEKTQTMNEKDKEQLTNQEKKEETQGNTQKPKEEEEEEERQEEEEEEEEPVLSEPEMTEPWRTILELSPDQKGHRDTHSTDTYLSLLPEEAMFLSYALGCLVLTHEGAEESYKGRKRGLDESTAHEMTIDEMWRAFTQQDARFPVKYAAYHHYRTLGWVVKDGLKYGVDYVLYPVGPAFYHSQYAVKVYSVWADTLTLDTTVPGHAISWTTTATTERLANHVNKTPILCFVLRPRALSQHRLGLIDCLKELKVQEMVLARWSPSNGAG